MAGARARARAAAPPRRSQPRCGVGGGRRRAPRAAPKLKDADISEDKARELYLQLVKTVRTMYHTCRLVHADLSEYNLLYVRWERLEHALGRARAQLEP